MTYSEDFAVALHEAMLLANLKPKGDLLAGMVPTDVVIDTILPRLTHSVQALIRAKIDAGIDPPDAARQAMEISLTSAIQLGFDVGRVFQAHGFEVPTQKESA